jgi:hypothetical protein
VKNWLPSLFKPNYYICLNVTCFRRTDSTYLAPTTWLPTCLSCRDSRTSKHRTTCSSALIIRAAAAPVGLCMNEPTKELLVALYSACNDRSMDSILELGYISALMHAWIYPNSIDGGWRLYIRKKSRKWKSLLLVRASVLDLTLHPKLHRVLLYPCTFILCMHISST